MAVNRHKNPLFTHSQGTGQCSFPTVFVTVCFTTAVGDMQSPCITPHFSVLALGLFILQSLSSSITGCMTALFSSHQWGNRRCCPTFCPLPLVFSAHAPSTQTASETGALHQSEKGQAYGRVQGYYASVFTPGLRGRSAMATRGKEQNVGQYGRFRTLCSDEIENNPYPHSTA